MSASPQSDLEYLWISNYFGLVQTTTVVYDYVLTSSREIDYIWERPQTMVFALFIMVRYLGLCRVLLSGIFLSSFFPNSVKVSVSTSIYSTPLPEQIRVSHPQGTILSVAYEWMWQLFVVAIDLFILRIYAMWNRSKIVLRCLLCIFVPERIISIVFTGLYNSPGAYYSVTTAQTSHTSVCSLSYNTPSPTWSYRMPSVTFAVSLLVLALIQTLKQSLDMYKATRMWQPNRYMKLLAREGIIYFLLRTLRDVTTILSDGKGGSPGILVLFLQTLVMTLLNAMLPRFIIGVREMYDHDVHRCPQGIDTGFGILSQPTAPRESATVTFSDVPSGQSEGVAEHVGESDVVPCEVV